MKLDQGYWKYDELPKTKIPINNAANIKRPAMIKSTPKNFEKTLNTAIIKSPKELPIFSAPDLTCVPKLL